MAETKAVFRRRIGRLLRILVRTTASGGSANTFIAESLLDFFPADDDLDGFNIYDVGESNWRRIEGWDASVFTGTVSRDFTNDITNNDVLEIYSTFNPDEIDDALEDALDEVYPYIAQTIEDTSLSGGTSTYEFTIPSTIRDLSRMYGGSASYQINTNQATYPYQSLIGWTVRDNRGAGGNYTLVVPPGEQVPTDRTIRLVGLAPVGYPATDAASIILESDTLRLLSWKVAEILWRDYAPQADGRDLAHANQRSQTYAGLYERAKDQMGQVLDPSNIRDVSFGTFIDLPLARNAEPS